MVKFRIVVVGHGPLPDALIASARLIGGTLDHVTSLGLYPGVTPTAYAGELTDLLAEDTPVLVLSDLRGGTPDNVANALARSRRNTAVVANASMALLLEAALGDVAITERALRPHLDAATPLIRWAVPDSGHPEP